MYHDYVFNQSYHISFNGLMRQYVLLRIMIIVIPLLLLILLVVMMDFGTADCGQFCAGCVLHKEERMQGRAVWTLVRHTFL